MTKPHLSCAAGIPAAVVILLSAAWPSCAQAPAKPPPAPGRYVPFDPRAEPAVRGEAELRKGVEGLRSGTNPFPDVVKQVGPRRFEIGTITLDLNARQARVPGRINMTRGIIEYLAVMEGRGKLHESILALDVQPSLLQLALILLGPEPGELSPGDPVTRTPPKLVKPGDPVLLSVEWERTGKIERIPADTLIFNRETQRPLERNHWYFTGSFFSRRGFAADITGSIAATWFDLRAMMNASAQAENPYRGANLGYEVNTSTVPPLNTPIRLIVEPATREPRGDAGR